MEDKTFYSLTTRCFTLRCGHPEWLGRTQLFYNQILLFYYNLFLDLVEEGEECTADSTCTGKDKKAEGLSGIQPGEDDAALWNKGSSMGKDANSQETGTDITHMNTQQILRELEKRSVVGRNREPVPNPLHWSRVPLYFRRAAANAAIAAGRSFLSREEQSHRAECFHEAVTYYKGTYRDFDEYGITLKVWTGREWKWLRCRLSGNKLLPAASLPNERPLCGRTGVPQAVDTRPAVGQTGSHRQGMDILSPSVVLKPGGIFLHVPVRERVENGSNARTRMAKGTSLCCVQFTNRDSIAVCVILDREGRLVSARFLKGGSRYRHSCRQILESLDKSKASTAGQEKLKPNQRYWMRLQNLSISYAHQISRQITDFAEEESCGIIVLPKYDRKYKSIVMQTVGNWSPLHLSNRIRSQLSYKAWQRGILVLEADARNTSNRCAVCGAALKKDGEEYSCANGHRGSRHINTAVNLGRKCRESFEGCEKKAIYSSEPGYQKNETQ